MQRIVHLNQGDINANAWKIICQELDITLPSTDVNRLYLTVSVCELFPV